MKNHRSISFCTLASLCLGTLTLLGACGQEDEPVEDVSVGQQRSAVLAGNGLSLNGNQIGPVTNGTYMDGLWLNATRVGATSLSGTTINLPASQGGTVTPVTNVTLDRTQFRGVKSGVPISGAQFRFARMPGLLRDGKKVTVRIESVQTAAAPNNDVYLYQMQYWITGVSTAWADLCQPGQLAIPASGRWDANGGHIEDPASVTFSCQNGAIAKCILLGYKPWLTQTESNGGGGTQTFSLRYHHQACTRAIRADYCGNGDSLTINGVVIDVYDYFDLAPRDLNYGWELESAWTTQGARFLYSPMGRPTVTNPDYNHPDSIPRQDMRGYVARTCPNKWNNVLWPADPNTSSDDALKLHEDTYQYSYWWPTDTWAPMETRVLLRVTH